MIIRGLVHIDALVLVRFLRGVFKRKRLAFMGRAVCGGWMICR
jgi:hypothetical protein